MFSKIIIKYLTRSMCYSAFQFLKINIGKNMSIIKKIYVNFLDDDVICLNFAEIGLTQPATLNQKRTTCSVIFLESRKFRDSWFMIRLIDDRKLANIKFIISNISIKMINTMLWSYRSANIYIYKTANVGIITVI